MIPEFDDQGYLPVGIHPATLDEIAARFGNESEIRQVQMDSIRWLVGIATHAGVLRIIVNGSFVADTFEPNDVDCALLIDLAYPRDILADAELQNGVLFVQAELLTQAAFEYYVTSVLAQIDGECPKA